MGLFARVCMHVCACALACTKVHACLHVCVYVWMDVHIHVYYVFLLHLYMLQAIQEYGNVHIYTANFRPLKATLSGLPDRVFMKIIVCASTNKVLGVHMCGEDSPEIIQVIYLDLGFF